MARAIVLAEVGNGLVIGCKPARQPHHLNVAPGLVLKPPARLNPIEIAVDVKLQQDRRMIRRSAGCLGIDPIKPKLGLDRVHRQRHRSPEPDCPRRSSLPGIPETACSARDPSPQRSASSDPPANREGILPRESNEAVRFYTAWVNRYRSLRAENRSMSVVPRKRRKVRALASVAKGHGGGRRESLQRPAMMVAWCHRQSAGPRLRLSAAFRR